MMPDAPGTRSARFDILLAGSPAWRVVFTHLWWTDAKPVEDPYAPDAALLHASRARVLAFADLIVPGHGAPFPPSASTPR